MHEADDRTRTRCTVLVIDDDPDTVYVYTHILRGHGFEVVACGDGAQVLGVARATRPDVILMDFLLPNCNGWEVTRALKRDPDTGAIPVVGISAYGDPARAGALEAGCADYFEKPVSPFAVLDRVRSLVGTGCEQDGRSFPPLFA